MFHVVLPVLKQPPNVRNVRVTMATLEWPAWSSEADEGDPPVVGYTIYVTNNTTGGLEGLEHVGANSNSITLSKLEPNTTYEFLVAAVREGEGGTGPASPPVYATTLPPGKWMISTVIRLNIIIVDSSIWASLIKTTTTTTTYD